MNKKLVLFDIDGTLISTNQNSLNVWYGIINRIFTTLFQTPFTSIDPKRVNGKVDYQLYLTMAQSVGISEHQFAEKKRDVFDMFHREMNAAVKAQSIQFFPIHEAVDFVELLALAHKDAIVYGVVTGNIERNGWMKLTAAGIRDRFAFGGFSDDVLDRPSLVRIAIRNAEAYTGQRFLPGDVIVIGDTHHDVLAGKSVGTHTVAVSTGFTHSHGELVAAGADLVVSSLMDPRVLSFVLSR